MTSRTQPFPGAPGGGTLIAVKSQVPPLRPRLVDRQRLLDRVLGDGSARLTVVVAPAGCGKTTLLGQWARQVQPEWAVAWVSLDESDDEPVRFWTYALTALREVCPGVAEGALRALRAPGTDPADVALPMLLNALTVTTERLVLVLDDYHTLTDPQLHRQVEFLVTYAPSALHVVVAGRSDPPLPLARLRASGQLSELRARDLRFSAEEARALVDQVADVALAPEASTEIVERTEGWAAGLHLAALSLREAADPVQKAAQLRGDHQHVLDYFDNEVLSTVKEEQRQLLLQCSMLERLCGPLCDAVLRRTGSAALLDELERANLFVTALDDTREWYHCHRLFRDALARELDLLEPALVEPLTLRAAHWFLDQGEVEEAVRYLLAGGDCHGAAELLATSVRWFVDRGAFRTYLRLGGQVPGSVADSHPDLCVALAWAAALTGQVERVQPWLDAAEASMTDDSPPLHGWHSLRAAARNVRAGSGHLADPDRAAGAIADAEEAVALETDPGLAGSAVAHTTLGRVLQAAGEPEAAVEVLSAALRLPAMGKAPGILRLQAGGALACALLDLGRLEPAAQVCRDMDTAAVALQDQWSDAAGPVLSLLRITGARVALARGDTGAARGLLTPVVATARVCGDPSHLVLALTALSEAELADGDPARAAATLAEARETAEGNWTSPAAMRDLRAVELRIGRGSSRVRPPGTPRPLLEDLTDRELSILRALQGQRSQREIGAALFISLNTVKGHTKSLYRKLDVASRQAAVQRGRALGLI